MNTGRTQYASYGGSGASSENTWARSTDAARTERLIAVLIDKRGPAPSNEPRRSFALWNEAALGEESERHFGRRASIGVRLNPKTRQGGAYADRLRGGLRDS